LLIGIVGKKEGMRGRRRDGAAARADR
jgi:hypothetical protein